MDVRLKAAILDNARWCHLVCATQGIVGRFDDDAWVSARRTPPMYPDAVTLTDDVSAEALLARVDRTAGCSVKDSFSTLDLSDAGFEVLFDARWLWRPAGPSTAGDGFPWERVEQPDELRAWSLEHGAGSTFSAALLDELSVTILAGRDRGGSLIAGAVATEGDDAIGISNVFAVDGAALTFAEAFAGATTAIVERFPDRPIVGYLSTDLLPAARAIGFEAIGPLRIWLLDDER
jgi:hypothetical protein